MRKLTRVAPFLFYVMALAAPVGGSSARAEPHWPELGSPARAVGGGEKDAAVVVGVENYAFVPDVPGAEANAKAWYDYLTKTRGVPAGSVKLLLDNDASREEVLAAAQSAAAKAGPGGTLWFVFIGHGAPAADGKDGLLVSVDAQQKAQSLQTRSVRRGELVKALASSRAGGIVAVLDACFSGRAPDGSALAPGLQPLVAVKAAGAGDPRLVLLTAAKGDQFAGALPGASRPAFSYLVLGGLRGWAGKARVSAGDLWRYASEALEATLRGRRQTPELTGSESALIAASAGEKGPDLAALAKATAGAGGDAFKVTAPAPEPEPGKKPPARGVAWVNFPGGSFPMGSIRSPRFSPVHLVTLKPFLLAKTLVTNAQYRACVDAGACTPAHGLDGSCLVPQGSMYGNRVLPASFLGDDQPVVCVDWEQAGAFSRWAGGRLPTDAEWEYAARSAGKEHWFPWGNEKADCALTVIDGDEGPGCGRNSTWPVCAKPSGNTEQGLCDMSGNAWQWVQDWDHESYYGAPADGSAWELPSGSNRCARGGSWNDPDSTICTFCRGAASPNSRLAFFGFRPARDADQPRKR